MIKVFRYASTLVGGMYQNKHERELSTVYNYIFRVSALPTIGPVALFVAGYKVAGSNPARNDNTQPGRKQSPDGLQKSE